MQRLLSKYGARWVLGLILVILALVQNADYMPEFVDSVVKSIDVYMYDNNMKAQPRVRDPRVVIVDIDEKSIAKVGRFPWGRNVIATLVANLTDYYKVRAIGFDVVFSEVDTSSGYETIEALAKGELKNIPGFAEAVLAKKAEYDYDGRLAKTLQNSPVVLGYFFKDNAEDVSTGVLPPPALTKDDFQGHKIEANERFTYGANLAVLQTSAKAGGFFSQVPDPDGVVRRVPLLMKVGNAYYESLALATFRVAVGGTAIRPIFVDEKIMGKKGRRNYGSLEAIALVTPKGERKIPVQNQFEMRIEFRGTGGVDGGSFRYVSAVDILTKTLPATDIEGRAILVGTTALGLNDNRASPTNANFPGVEMHANIIASLLNGKFKIEPDYAATVNLLQIIIFGLGLALLLPRLTPMLASLVTIGAMAAISGLNFWAYQSANLVLPAAAVLLLILSLFVVNIAFGFLYEIRHSRAMASRFGEYVAPELVAEMANDPAAYNMEGENRELTVLFVDVRGFTTISEGLPPKELREYINIYLTAMSEDIRGNRGTLDKYIGDAVMAFWGAPVAFTDHATRAVESAMKMQVSARVIDEEFGRRGWPHLKIGIGLSTGQMSVGDMGSKVRKAYTVMGDAVNLGSRLEGITKNYGVGIVVSEMTKLAAPEFEYRELDKVIVKGKNEPVPIFEPIGKQFELGENVRAELDKWHRGLNLIRLRQWDHAEGMIQELHKKHPQDRLYELYLERIAGYHADPPGEDWDGVTRYETK